MIFGVYQHALPILTNVKTHRTVKSISKSAAPHLLEVIHRNSRTTANLRTVLPCTLLYSHCTGDTFKNGIFLKWLMNKLTYFSVDEQI